MSLVSLNPVASQQPVEGAIAPNEKNELNAQNPIVEGAQPQQTFEWNVQRLFLHNENHSLFRTWFVRILALVVGIPTLLLDLARLGAFQLGLVNGKSFSLIDGASDVCQALANKVSGVYQSMMAEKELTLAQQNEILKQRMQDAAKRYIAGFNSLNGGYLHSNSSFSTPHALSAEKAIQRAKADLAQLSVEFIALNANSANNFTDVVETALSLVLGLIQETAKGEVYIEDKTKRMGPRLSLGSVAIAEFKDAFDRLASKGVFANQFIDIAHRGDHFIQDLKKGVELGVLSEAQAKEALSGKAQEIYMQGLETGAQEAETVVTVVLNTAIKEGVVSRDEAVVINEKIQPNVEDLAVATAKDLVRDDTPEVQIKTKLIQASNILQKAKRLKGPDVSTFLTSAEAALTKAKRELEAERTRLKEEADRMEAARVALAQKETDQQNLLDQFVGMLDLIATKQRALTAQFATYDEMEVERQTLTQQLNALREETVTIRGSSVTVFSAASDYAEALSAIMSSRMTPVERKRQMDALEEQGFTKQTIAKIEQLRVLEPQLRDLINRQAAIAIDAEKNHDEIVRLRAVYQVFRKRHIKGLIKPNRQAIVAKEAVVQRAQKALNDRHLDLIGKSGIRARLSLDQPSVPVNVDLEANEQEVRSLVELFRKPVVVDASTPKKEEELAPAASTIQWIYNGVTAPFRWATGVRV